MAAESLSFQLNYVSMHLHANMQRLQYIISTASTTSGIVSLYAKKESRKCMSWIRLPYFSSQILNILILLMIQHQEYVEPVATMPKTMTYFQGIHQTDVNYQFSLHVDDLLLCLTHPVNCTSKVTQILGEFETFFWLKDFFS